MRSAVPKPEANRGTTAAKVVDGRVIDGAAGGSHHTGLYAFDAIAPRAYGLDAIGADAFRAYHEQGFIAVEKAFAPEQMTGVIEALEEQITDDDSGTVVQYEAWAAKKIEQLDNKERILAARKLTVFVASDPRLQDIAAHPAMLEIVSRLMGGADPVLLQEMALLKPPGGREKPWHQDRAYFNVHRDDPIVGVWVALDEATPENGCMRLWPGRHRGGPITHFQRRDWQLCDRDVTGTGRLAVPLKPGGVLFFHPLLPHGTPHNGTDQRRWAIQFHYHPKEARITEDEERLAIFGSEGTGVEC
jgi:phytanoyl-CoA hydroxylase